VRTGTLDVPDDAAGGVVHEFDADLGDTSSGTYKDKLLSANLSFCRLDLVVRVRIMVDAT